MKHTPGPWTLCGWDSSDKEITIIAGDGYYEGSTISVDYDDCDHDLAEANARLIAAAPDFYQVAGLAQYQIDKIANQLAEKVENQAIVQELGALAVTIRTVIAKATGGQA